MAEHSHARKEAERNQAHLNGHVKDSEAQLLSGLAGTEEPPYDWDRPKFSKKQAAIIFGIWGSLVLVLICAIIFLAVKLPAVPESSDASSASPCPPDWKENEGRCYFFSDVERNWTFSRSNCSSYGASLVTLDNQKEMEYVIGFIGHELYWIGLCRDDIGEPWKLSNGSIFNNWFPIKLDGFCAYLRKDSVRSAECFSVRFWICTKPAVKAGSPVL